MGLSVLPPDINRTRQPTSPSSACPMAPSPSATRSPPSSGWVRRRWRRWRKRAATGPSPVSPISPSGWTPACSTRCSWRTSSRRAPSMTLTGTARGSLPVRRCCSKRAQATAEDRGSGQIGLFGGLGAKPEPLRLPEMVDWPMLDRLGYEAEAIGLPPHQPSAGQFRLDPEAPRCDVQHAARGGGREWDGASEGRRHHDRPTQRSGRRAPVAAWPGCGSPTAAAASR